jgi:hypothetical protein
MEQSSEADVYPKLFEFVERDQAGSAELANSTGNPMCR